MTITWELVSVPLVADLKEMTRVPAYLFKLCARVLAPCALLLACCPSSSEITDEISIGTRRVIRSEILNEDRTLYIYLPESYEQSRSYRRYPVLYLRDGGKFFHSFTGAVQQLTSDATPHAPEMIVVAISETDRVRDSSSTYSLTGFTGKQDEGFRTSGGGQRFLQFLREELAPYIDREFSTSSYRIYCGYSFTGLSAIDAVLDARNEFDAFVIIDPSWWWDDYALERSAERALTNRRFDRVQLFLAASGESYPERYFMNARDVRSFADMLERKRPRGLDWSFQRYADESHHSMPQRALYDGLSYIFRGYKPSLNELYTEPERLRLRYEEIAKRLGERFALNEGLLSFFGDQFLNAFKEPDRALVYFDLATEYYPGSSAAWENLGKAHNARGDKTAATGMYEKALALDPKNENARRTLQSLRGE